MTPCYITDMDNPMIRCRHLLCLKLSIYPSLKLTANALKIGLLPQKERKLVFQASIFRCELLVSGRVYLHIRHVSFRDSGRVYINIHIRNNLPGDQCYDEPKSQRSGQFLHGSHHLGDVRKGHHAEFPKKRAINDGGILKHSSQNHQLPRNSASLFPFWDAEVTHLNGCSKWPPTIGDQVWSRIEPPTKTYLFCVTC